MTIGPNASMRSTAAAARKATNLRRGTRTTGTLTSMPTRPLHRVTIMLKTMTTGTTMVMGIPME
jgi:hypothetical protein